ncbi:YceI family protein [uncultured Methylibium sp.]|uniref:YceI family protein n=1 Tax=uncultured Methylibium sp. TaxID=381093 RepID=UPI0025FB95D4|nr:YceI family protein [uncultured Methylibium sp.]
MRTLSVTLVSLASAALLTLALADPAVAQAAPAKLLPGSEIGFVSKQMGVPVSGKFTRFDAQIAFDPRKPETGKVGFTIDIGSATIGDPETDRELPKAPWFNAAKFPQASFQSSSIKALGGGRFEVAGKLAIKGNSQDVVVPVALTQSGGNSTATGAFAIKRLAFKIGEGEWTDTSMVADEVQVKFKLALTGVGPL